MTAVPVIDTSELSGKAFACLEGCGFCCTMQPEASKAELAALRQRVTPLPVTFSPDGRTYLGLQNACGACTLLMRRECSQYDARPAHCRYFPFHLYLGERAQAYLNYSCRGVTTFPTGDLTADFTSTFILHAESAEAGRIAREAATARGVYETFRKRAVEHDAWVDPAPLVAEAQARCGALVTRAGVERAALATGERVGAEALARLALEPFENENAAARPYYLDADLRWLTFRRRGRDALVPAMMDEAGSFTPVPDAPRLDGLDAWWEPPAPLAEKLGAVLADRLLTRDVFVGGVFDRVDELDYDGTVAEAFGARLAEHASALVLRARIVAAFRPALVQDAAAWADEAWRFYDTEFLDQPVIGGFA